jgi:hypothetical protein
VIAFLFVDSDVSRAVEAFLAVLAQVREAQSLRSRVFQGALLVHALSRVTIGGSRDKDGSSSYVEAFDRTIFRTIALGMATSVTQQRHTFSDDDFRHALFRPGIWCVALATCTISIADGVDQWLRMRHSKYLGYLEIDLANPVQYELFVSLLSHGTQIDGQTILEAWPEEVALSQDYPPYVRVAVQESEFERIADPIPKPDAATQAGADLVARVRAARGRAESSLRHRVLVSGFRGSGSFSVEPPSDDHADPSTRRGEPATGDLRQKLVEYALNPNHKDGKHKARVFAGMLGIDQNEWLYLETQILRSLPSIEIVNIRQSKHGTKFSAFADVTGLNGRAATLEMGWIIEGDRVRLTTVYIAGSAKQRNRPTQESYRIGAATTNELYQGILRLAHDTGAKAASEANPTPTLVTIDNARTEIITDCGSAFINVPDARRGFARWLVRTGNGCRGIWGGADVWAPRTDQSLERAKAYADAFALVLRENGISCSVKVIDD